jgi:TonB family protein
LEHCTGVLEWNTHLPSIHSLKEKTMKTVISTKGFARFLTLSAWLSVLTLAAFAGSPDNKTPDEKKSKENFVRSEVLPCTEKGTDVGTAVIGRIEYPEQAVNQEVEGLVIVEFTIDETGKAVDYHIIQDIGGNCGRTVVKAIGDMHFLPAVQNGYPVPCRIQVPVQFKLL